QEFGLVVGEPAEVRFLGSNTRREDAGGALIEEWEGQIEELSPLSPTLEAAGKEGHTVPVHLHSKVTEVGTLELSCLSRDGKQRWKLEFNVRERQEEGAGGCLIPMSMHRFLDNPAYVAYVRQLLKLQSLMAQGQGESPQAGALCDESCCTLT